MANKEPGYVYILTNPCYRADWVKIGKSRRPVDVRSKELNKRSSNDFQYEIAYQLDVEMKELLVVSKNM